MQKQYDVLAKYKEQNDKEKEDTREHMEQARKVVMTLKQTIADSKSRINDLTCLSWPDFICQKQIFENKRRSDANWKDKKILISFYLDQHFYELLMVALGCLL